MSQMIEDELNDYLDQVKWVLHDIAIRMAKDERGDMYRDLSRLVYDHLNTVDRVKELEEEIKKLREEKGNEEKSKLR